MKGMSGDRILVRGLIVAVMATGCADSRTAGRDEGTPTPMATPAPTPGEVNVTLLDRHITPSSQTAPAGEVTFNVHNEGPSRHELVVIRTDLPETELPEEDVSGFPVVDERARGLKVVDETKEMLPGVSVGLTVDLKPGSYVLICNIRGHYRFGMHAAFSVS
jgi:uncharacterized cupredoxin-like copper-binding protein